MKKLLFLLFFAGLMPHLSSAQLVLGGPKGPSAYQLVDGTKDEGKLRFIPDGSGELLVRQDKKRTVYLPEQITYFDWGGYRFEPVYNFSFRIDKKRSMSIKRDFAAVLDTGRITLLKYTHMTMGTKKDATGKIKQQLYAYNAYLLRLRNSSQLVAIPDFSSMVSEGKFDPEAQDSMLQTFNNDTELKELLAQNKLTAKNFPDYVRAYNQRNR